MRKLIFAVLSASIALFAAAPASAQSQQAAPAQTAAPPTSSRAATGTPPATLEEIIPDTDHTTLLQEQVTDLTQQLDRARNSVGDLAGKLTASNMEAAAWKATTDCTLGHAVSKTTCFLKVLKEHPGTKASDIAFNQVSSGIQQAGETPRQPATDDRVAAAIEKLALSLQSNRRRR